VRNALKSSFLRPTCALFIKSGVHLPIDEGVEIRGVQNLSAYPVMDTRIAGVEMRWPSALINVNGYEQSNVKISGRGVIDGEGKPSWDKYWKMRREEYEPKGLRWAVDYDCQRPRLIQIYKSSNIELQDMTLKRPGFWTVHSAGREMRHRLQRLCDLLEGRARCRWASRQPAVGEDCNRDGRRARTGERESGLESELQLRHIPRVRGIRIQGIHALGAQRAIIEAKSAGSIQNR
jgi:hypothetical protein